jgi:hypothetical protein
VRVRIHGCAVLQVAHCDQIGRQIATEELTYVGAAAQTVITGAALRSARHADAIADLHAAHFGANCFDDADTTVSLNQRQ